MVRPHSATLADRAVLPAAAEAEIIERVDRVVRNFTSAPARVVRQRRYDTDGMSGLTRREASKYLR